MSNVSVVSSRGEDTEINIVASGKADKANYPRVTIRLTGDMGDIIAELQKNTFAATPSDVIRRAVIVYHTLVQQKLQGNESYIEKNDSESVKKIPIFL